MTDILCRWLNEEVKFSKRVGKFVRRLRPELHTEKYTSVHMILLLLKISCAERGGDARSLQQYVHACVCNLLSML